MPEPISQLTAEPTSVASVSPRRIAQPTRLSPGVMTYTDVIANEAGALRQSAGMLSRDVARLHGDSLRIQLRARTDEAAKRAPADLLAELGALGFSWTAVARVLGVSIPAVRKWRSGAMASGTNRRKIAEFTALVGVLERDHMIADVASWLEVPLAESSFTGIDVLEAGASIRPDRVRSAAHRQHGSAGPVSAAMARQRRRPVRGVHSRRRREGDPAATRQK